MVRTTGLWCDRAFDDPPRGHGRCRDHHDLIAGARSSQVLVSDALFRPTNYHGGVNLYAPSNMRSSAVSYIRNLNFERRNSAVTTVS